MKPDSQSWPGWYGADHGRSVLLFLSRFCGDQDGRQKSLIFFWSRFCLKLSGRLLSGANLDQREPAIRGWQERAGHEGSYLVRLTTEVQPSAFCQAFVAARGAAGKA